MRILVDENAAMPMLAALRHLLPAHKLDHVTEIHGSGKKDLPILADAARRGYEVFLTRDARQLEDPAETKAIMKAAIHHVRYSQTHQGLAGLGLAMGAVIASMPMIMKELGEAEGQRLVHIAGLDPTAKRRFTMQDPRQDQPKYWRR